MNFRLIKKEGDAVGMDEVVLEIETDKTALPVMSPGNGKIVKMLVKEGQSVKSQQPLFQVTDKTIYTFLFVLKLAYPGIYKKRLLFCQAFRIRREIDYNRHLF